MYSAFLILINALLRLIPLPIEYVICVTIGTFGDTNVELMLFESAYWTSTSF